MPQQRGLREVDRFMILKEGVNGAWIVMENAKKRRFRMTPKILTYTTEQMLVSIR